MVNLTQYKKEGIKKIFTERNFKTKIYWIHKSDKIIKSAAHKYYEEIGAKCQAHEHQWRKFGWIWKILSDDIQ